MMYGPSLIQKKNADRKSNESTKKSESATGKSVKSVTSATTPIS